MLPSILPLLRCPDRCRAPLALERFVSDGDDVTFGRLECTTCGQGYPILAGVAVLVPNPSAYMSAHAAGVRATVDWTQLDRAQRLALLGPAEPTPRQLDPMLERARIEYVTRHHLRADPRGVRWWEGASESFLTRTMLELWDRDPMSLAVRTLASIGPVTSLLDLGTNVGGLACAASAHVDRVIGVDLSLVATHWGRNHLRGGVAIDFEPPGDRLRAAPGARVVIPAPPEPKGVVELIVADVRSPPVEAAAWDTISSLNLIDLLDEPELLPRVQRALLRPGGHVLSASPYSLSETSAARLRRWAGESTSAAVAVDRMYADAGFTVRARQEDVPWLFYKNPRQVELYAAHFSVYSRAVAPS